MRFCTTKKLDLKEIDMRYVDRTKLGVNIARYYLGKQNSNIGVQYIDFKDGKIVKSKYTIERRDILIFHYPNAFNLFVDFNRDHTSFKLCWNMFDDAELSADERHQVESFIFRRLEHPTVKAFCDEQRAFFQAEPWKQIDGMTPAEALDKLEQLGWYRKEQETA